MASVLFELALILLITTAVSALLYWFKQPGIVAYVVAGVLLGPSVLSVVQPTAEFQGFADIGLALLLFILGLSLNPRIFKELGKVSVGVGLGQVFLTSLAGFTAGVALGFSPVEALFLGLAFSFSSTIVIVRMLSDNGELDLLHGRIIVGLLLVQDLVAVLVMGAVSSNLGSLVVPLVVGVVASALVWVVHNYVAPRIVPVFSKSPELLFLFGLAWCFAWAAGLQALNFPFQIGALMAGVSLAGTVYSSEITSKIRSLRDFFIVLFFISLGSRVDLSSLSLLVVPVLVLSVVVAALKPLVVMALLKFFGYGKKVGFSVGLPMSQLSEFSLTLLLLAASSGLVSPTVAVASALCVLAMMFTSSYLIAHSQAVYSLTERFLNAFDGAGEKSVTREKTFDALLVGYRRSGYSVAKSLDRVGAKVLTVDINPDAVKQLEKEHRLSQCVDAEDAEFLESLPVKRLKYVVSTVSSHSLNTALLSRVRGANPLTILILTTESVDEAVTLYGLGADYVIVPRLVGGFHLSSVIQKNKHARRFYLPDKERQLKELKRHLSKGFDY